MDFTHVTCKRARYHAVYMDFLNGISLSPLTKGRGGIVPKKRQDWMDGRRIEVLMEANTRLENGGMLTKVVGE